MIREEHTAFYRRIFGAVQVGRAESLSAAFNVPVVALRCRIVRDNRETILKRFPFFKSTPVEQRLMFAKPRRGELAPLTILPTAKYYRDAA